MEGNTNKVKTNHPDFNECFSRYVIEATRKNPEQRIALFANNLTNPAYEGKVIESILCDRECCQVVSQGGENKSNIELIKEYLYSNDESSRKNAADIIRNLFSEENIGTVLKNDWLIKYLPSLLKDMIENESLKDEAMGIIRNLFSEENIGTVLKSDWFIKYLPSLLKDMIENKSLKNDVKYIIKNMFLSNMSSNKNLGEVLRRVDLSLGRFESATGNIIKGLAEEMLKKEYKDFENKAPNIIKDQIFTKKNIASSSKNITPMLSSSSAQKEIPNRENSSVRDGINGSLKSIMPMLDSSFSKKVMSNYGNKTEDSASDFIKDILGNNSVPEELKSELNDISKDFLGKKRKFPADTLIEKEEKTRNRKLAVSLREG